MLSHGCGFDSLEVGAYFKEGMLFMVRSSRDLLFQLFIRYYTSDGQTERQGDILLLLYKDHYDFLLR